MGMFHVKPRRGILTTGQARRARAIADVSSNVGRYWQLRERRRDYDRQIAQMLAEFEQDIITEKAAREHFGLPSPEQKDI